MNLREIVCFARDGTRLVVQQAYSKKHGAEGLVLLHANGFSASTYKDLVELLSSQFTVFAVNLRGHGASDDGPASKVSGSAARTDIDSQLEASVISQEQLEARMEGFPMPYTDLIDVLHQLDLKKPVCFGHSVGGSMALVAEIANPGLWRTICVYEPPVTATEEQDRGNRKAAARLASTARKRRRDFNSFSDAKEQLQGKIPFSLLTASSLDGFVESCLNPNDSGGVSLRCSIEARTFEGAWQLATIIRDRIHTIRCPVTFCRGIVNPKSPDNDMVAALENLASWCPTAQLYTFPQMTHMGPLSHPAILAEVICKNAWSQSSHGKDEARGAQPQQVASRL